MIQAVDVDAMLDLLDDGSGRARGVLDRVAPALGQRLLAHPADHRVQLVGGGRLILCLDDHVAAGDVDLVGQAQRHRHRGERGGDLAAVGVDRGHRRAVPAGQDDDLGAGVQQPAGHLAGVAAVVVVLIGHRADHPLHREADVVEVAVRRDHDVLQVVEQRRGAVPLHLVRATHHVVAVERGDRDEGDVGDLQARDPVGHLLEDLVEDGLLVVDEVHLVDAHHEMGDAQQRGDVGVAAGLLRDPLARVDQHDREVGGRGAGDHVARVLLVARRVGDDELAPGGLEVAVGDVDRDPLLALGAQAVGEQRQVDVAVAAALGGLDHVLHLVLEDRLGVVQQPPDQGRLAVVDRARGRDPQQLVAASRGRVRAGIRRGPVAVGPHDRHPRSTPRACDPPSPPPSRGHRHGSRRAR